MNAISYDDIRTAVATKDWATIYTWASRLDVAIAIADFMANEEVKQEYIEFSSKMRRAEEYASLPDGFLDAVRTYGPARNWEAIWPAFKVAKAKVSRLAESVIWLELGEDLQAEWMVFMCAKAKSEASKAKLPTSSRACCPKCGGKGYISHYRHVERGDCFACNATGIKGGIAK